MQDIPKFDGFEAITVARRGFLTATALGTIGAAATLGMAAATSPALAQDAEPANALGQTSEEVDIAALPRVRQKLVAPPFLPDHEQIATSGPRIIEVEMTIHEKLVEIDDEGATIWAFAYEGFVPGPMIVCHQGDYVELTLKSAATNMLEHNIDFHAATGAMGGGELTMILPGEQVVLRWRALKAGVFVYHCAPGAEMTPYHVVHGMNGSIMVLPRDGLKDASGAPAPYDRAYYIGEQDYYLPRDAEGNWIKYETPMDDFSDSLAVMRGLIPTHVVFSGKRDALTGDNAMTAKVGEAVLFIHAQANRDTRPHLIGGPWRSGLGDGVFQRQTGHRSGNLVHSWRLCGGGPVPLPPARNLCLCQPQPDRSRS